LVGRRDRALLVVGFAGAFRRSELAALELGDLEKRPEGYVVTVRRSKTDQEGRGQQKGLPYGSDPATCPVRTLDAWLSAAEITEGRVFRSIAWHGAIGASLSPRAIAQIVKRHCELAGLEPSKYGAHSLRSGFVTTAARAGKSTRSIMDQTGHRTVAIVFGYVKSAALFEENAAMGIGL
jgi:integrase